MITKTIAMSLRHGQTLYHRTSKNRDGTPLRCRVNGQCKVWKTRPDDFRLPVKHGLRDCFYITPSNAHEWSTEENSQGIPIGQVEFIVGNMYVGTRPADVVKEFARRFRRARRERGTRFPRTFRKATYRYALKVHQANRDLVREFRL